MSETLSGRVGQRVVEALQEFRSVFIGFSHDAYEEHPVGEVAVAGECVDIEAGSPREICDFLEGQMIQIERVSTTFHVQSTLLFLRRLGQTLDVSIDDLADVIGASGALPLQLDPDHFCIIESYIPRFGITDDLSRIPLYRDVDTDTVPPEGRPAFEA